MGFLGHFICWTKSNLGGVYLTTVPVLSWSQSLPYTGWCPSNSQTHLSGRGGWELLFQLLSGECWFSVLPGGRAISTDDFHSALPCFAQILQSDTDTIPSVKPKYFVTKICCKFAHFCKKSIGKDDGLWRYVLRLYLTKRTHMVYSPCPSWSLQSIWHNTVIWKDGNLNWRIALVRLSW